MRSFPLIGDVGIVIVRDCTHERQTIPAEYTLIPLCTPNIPSQYSQSIQEESVVFCLVTDCTLGQRRTVQLEYTPHNPALILK